MDPTRLYTSEIPPFHMRLLLFWAFCDRKTKTTLAKDILVARAEVNADLIDRKMADTAAGYGLPLPLFQAVVLAADGQMSVSQLHRLLSEGLSEDELRDRFQIPVDAT